MSPDMEPISGIATIDAPASAPALDGIAIGAVRRLTIARIESRRVMSDKSCTLVECHGERGERRAGLYTFRLVLPTCCGAPSVAEAGTPDPTVVEQYSLSGSPNRAE
jgi:hypothetical protein